MSINKNLEDIATELQERLYEAYLHLGEGEVVEFWDITMILMEEHNLISEEMLELMKLV